MSDNVIGLFGDGGGDDGEPDERIVEVLENALERAKAGRIRDILIIYHDGINLHRVWAADNFDTLGSIHLGACASIMQMQAELLAAGGEE